VNAALQDWCQCEVDVDRVSPSHYNQHAELAAQIVVVAQVGEPSMTRRSNRMLWFRQERCKKAGLDFTLYLPRQA
jgi:hypothetical protein